MASKDKEDYQSSAQFASQQHSTCTSSSTYFDGYNPSSSFNNTNNTNTSNTNNNNKSNPSSSSSSLSKPNSIHRNRSDASSSSTSSSFTRPKNLVVIHQRSKSDASSSSSTTTTHPKKEAAAAAEEEEAVLEHMKKRREARLKYKKNKLHQQRQKKQQQQQQKERSSNNESLLNNSKMVVRRGSNELLLLLEEEEDEEDEEGEGGEGGKLQQHQQSSSISSSSSRMKVGNNRNDKPEYMQTHSDTELLHNPYYRQQQQQVLASATDQLHEVPTNPPKSISFDESIINYDDDHDNVHDHDHDNDDDDDSEASSVQNHTALTADTLSAHNSQEDVFDTVAPPTLETTPRNHNNIEMIINNNNSSNTATTAPSSASQQQQHEALVEDTSAIQANSNSNNNNNTTSPPNPLQLENIETKALAQNFAMEHRIFLRAILQLLTERDQYAVGVDVNDPHTIKTGPLKKGSHVMRGAIWKVKYVEIRRGLFSYYENEVSDTSTGQLQRKSIPLRANSCTCRAVKVKHKTLTKKGENSQKSGFIFELTVESDVKWKRLWMASTREDRQAWIHAIHDAMIGGSVTRGDNFLDYQRERTKKNKISVGRSGDGKIVVPTNSPYRENLEEYLRIQEEVKRASIKEEYVNALAPLCGVPLNVPVQWIKENVESMHSENAEKAFVEDTVSSGIDQLWKDMLRDSVKINGDLFVGDGGHGPEQIIGALTRCIMKFDKSSPQTDANNRIFRNKFRITESAALSYARDILLACNRTRSGGDSYYCVDTLCSNPHLVVLCPSSTVAEPLSITVKHAVVEEGVGRASIVQKYSEISGWLMVKTKSQKHWRKRFGVLSEGVLSFYRHDTPRPYGLQRQIILAGATMTRKNDADNQQKISPPSLLEASSINYQSKRNLKYVVRIKPADKSKKEQLISFDGQSSFVLWNKAIAHAISPPKTTTAHQALCPIDLDDKEGQQQQEEKEQQNHDNENDNEDKSNNTEGRMDLRKQFSTAKHRAVSKRYSERMKLKAGRARSTVEVLVKASAMYKICTTDPQGDEEEDTWVMLRTNFLQKFRLSGGPNGRIMRGEEVVQLNFLQGLVSDDAFQHVFD